MTLWPWSELRRLNVELNAARRSCSAEMKRVNRLSRRIQILERACEKHLRQERSDQFYIDALEARLESTSILAAREELKA